MKSSHGDPEVKDLTTMESANLTIKSIVSCRDKVVQWRQEKPINDVEVVVGWGGTDCEDPWGKAGDIPIEIGRLEMGDRHDSH